MNIAIGADHGGLKIKEAIVDYLKQQHISFKDFGTNSDESVDYPDYAHPVAKGVEEGQYDCGILVCGSGQGMCMAANKHSRIRAALCWSIPIAKLSRQHNNANVICLPGRFLFEAEAIEIIKTFLATPFEGGRHDIRINKIRVNKEAKQKANNT